MRSSGPGRRAWDPRQPKEQLMPSTTDPKKAPLKSPEETPAVQRDLDAGASAVSPASAFRAATGGPSALTAADLFALQGTAGNQAVMRLIQANRSHAGGEDPAHVHRAAKVGTGGPGGALPHLGTIQKAFGRHDVTGVVAHTGAQATAGAQAMGAAAFTTGHHVAFAGSADLHTAAHEAAHVVQQRGGVQLAGGVGQVGDRYERHADAVADAVVRGRSVEGLLDPYAGAGMHQAPAAQRAVQRAITIDHIDYNPKTNQYRDGFINQAAFYLAVRGRMLADAQFGAPYINHWANVQPVLAAQDFNAPDIDQMTAALRDAIIGQYGGARPVIAGGRVHRLEDIVRRELIANIQPDHEVAMTGGEANAYDQLAQAANATVSRGKGVPNTIPYANLPGGVRAEVTARLTEIRNERARWTVAALTANLTLPNGDFIRDVITRQKALRYQGNHTNNAGWLPVVAAPADQVTAVAATIYHHASSGLAKRLGAANALVRLDYAGFGGAGRNNKYRAEYDQLRGQYLAGLNNNGVKLSAMAALCQGVSAYIEFSMAGDISRLVYDPVNNHVYISAHYKWREGKNPFFQVLAFPAV